MARAGGWLTRDKAGKIWGVLNGKNGEETCTVFNATRTLWDGGTLGLVMRDPCGRNTQFVRIQLMICYWTWLLPKEIWERVKAVMISWISGEKGLPKTLGLPPLLFFSKPTFG